MEDSAPIFFDKMKVLQKLFDSGDRFIVNVDSKLKNAQKQWVGQRSKLASNNFISKLQRRCTDLSFITTHIKALIKGSISRLLWLEDIFQEMPPSNICRWRDLLYVAALQLLASLVFHLLGPQSLASITSITVVTKLRLCRKPPTMELLGLQRRPLQFVDRPGVHNVRHL